MAHADDAHAADVFDFVDAYAAALERGEERTLAYWLARFPASQDAIAHEWLALRRPVDGVRADPATAPTIAGPDRIGPYRLISELGRGGQGTVFLAEDTRILRRVALKVLASRFDTIRDDKLRRFRREAEIIARLEHPSLCTVYEADLEGEVPYLAMRYVEGRTLADVLADAKEQDEASETVRLDSGDDTTPRATAAHFPPRSKLELDQVLLFFERAARALHAAHEAGVVHRDVKPGNVIVTTDGKPVLLDFGLARDESETDASRITESGEVFGTPSYMSPEQLQFASDALDRRTDVYSLGVALYEALTLHRPFEQAARPALYLAIQSQMPPDPRDFNAYLPEDVAVVIETALEKDRGRRYATALALAEDLRRIRQYEPIHARPAGVGLRFSRWVRRHPAVAAATIGTILSLSAGLIVALLALKQKDAALSVALGKHLAQRSIELVNEDAGAALALGIMAAERAPGYQTMSSLYPALDGCWLEYALGGDPTSKLMSDLAVDPHGKYVIGAFPDGVAHVWDLRAGQRVTSIDPGHGAIDVLDVDPAGARVALAAIDGSITIASIPAAQSAFTVDTGERATRLEYSTDGAFLLVRAATGAVRMLDPGTRSIVAEAPGPFLDARWIADDRVALFPASGIAIADARLAGADSPRFEGTNTLASDVSADGRRLALALADGTIEVRDARSLELVARATGLSAPVCSLQLSPAGDRLALRIGDDDRAAPWLWNLGSAPRELRDAGSRGVAKLRFSPDGQRIASVGASTIVHVWDAHSGELRRTFRLAKRQLEAAWSPDGSRLVTATAGFAYVWFARARPDTFDFEGHAGAVRAVRVAGDGDRVLSASADGTARVWSLATGGLVQTLQHGAPLVDARFVDSGALVVTAGEDGIVRAWEAHSGAVRGATPAITGGIASIAAQDASPLVAIVGRDGAAYAWDATASGTLTALEIAPEEAFATCATCLSNPARTAWGFADGRVVVVDSASLRPLTHHFFQHSVGEPCSIVALDAAKGGAELAVGCSDQFVRFWRPGERAESRPERKGFYLRAIEWDPRGERVLALGLEPGTKAVHVLDAADDKRITPRNAHRANITCAGFSPDGTQVSTGAADGSVFVWSAFDGAPSVQRTDLGASVRCVTFVQGASGPSIAAGLEDGRIRVWPLDPLSAARARQPRALDDWELDRERALAAPLPFD